MCMHCVFLLQKVNGGKGKKGNGVSTPFRRVEGDINVDPRLVDNSFEAKVSYNSELLGKASTRHCTTIVCSGWIQGFVGREGK